MKTNKNHSRRDFLQNALKHGLTTGLAYMGISFDQKDCPAAACYDCFELGLCKKEQALRTRMDIKTNHYKNKVAKGTHHGG